MIPPPWKIFVMVLRLRPGWSGSSNKAPSSNRPSIAWLSRVRVEAARRRARKEENAKKCLRCAQPLAVWPHSPQPRAVVPAVSWHHHQNHHHHHHHLHHHRQQHHHCHRLGPSQLLYVIILIYAVIHIHVYKIIISVRPLRVPHPWTHLQLVVNLAYLE